MKEENVFKFLKKYLKGNKKLLTIILITTLLSSILVIFYGYLIGEVVKYITDNNLKTATIILLIYGLIYLTDIIINNYGRRKLSILSNKIIAKISADTYNKITKLPARAFEEKTSGELINIITSDSGKISDTLTQMVFTSMSVISTVIVFIYIMLNSVIIGLEILLFVIIFAVLSKYFLPKIKEKNKIVSEIKDKSLALATESIRGIREVKSLGIRSQYVNMVDTVIEETFEEVNKSTIYENNYYDFLNTVAMFLEVTVFLTCIFLIHKGKMEISFFISMTYYIYRFMSISEKVMRLVTSIQKSKVAVKRIENYTENKIYQDEKFGDINTCISTGNITFKNVVFKYENENKNIFENLNLNIEANKITALVGSSGSGKTSIFNLLCRFFDVSKGSIELDGINIEDFTESSLRKNIAIIRQEPFIFNKTIAENFKLIDEKLTIQKIKEACAKAEIHDYIMSLPKKYDTLIGEGGVNLSGGQKQRMSIARALLKESKIILFDEATSALDNENQEKIKEVTKKLSKNHTIIIIAHRLTTIENADVIHIIDKGKIVESGIHKELLKNSAIYKKLYSKEDKK